MSTARFVGARPNISGRCCFLRCLYLDTSRYTLAMSMAYFQWLVVPSVIFRVRLAEVVHEDDVST